MTMGKHEQQRSSVLLHSLWRRGRSQGFKILPYFLSWWESPCVCVAISTESEQVPLQASYDQTLQREGQALHVIPSPGQAQNRACLSDKPGKQTRIPEPQLSAAAPSVMGLKQNSPHQTWSFISMTPFLSLSSLKTAASSFSLVPMAHPSHPLLLVHILKDMLATVSHIPGEGPLFPLFFLKISVYGTHLALF